jgi:hypothetical protein
LDRDVYQRVRQGILNELEAHKDDIEGGLIAWFQIRVSLNRDLRSTWQHEEEFSMNQIPRAVKNGVVAK